MSAELIEGGPIADRIMDQVRANIEELHTTPKLAAILAADNAGAGFYARSKKKL